MKTPLQELISDFDKMLENTDSPTGRHVIGQCIRKAYDMAEKEKKTIETSFADGFVEGFATQKSGIQELYPEQYYNNTFEK